MKTTIRKWPLSAVILTAIAITSCTIDLPDLNPNPPEGGDIVIFDIGDVIEFTSNTIYPVPEFQEFYREYDLGSDGTIDIVMEDKGCDEVIFIFQEAQVALDEDYIINLSTSYAVPLFLPVNALTGGTFTSDWAGPTAKMRLFEESSAYSCDPPYHITPDFPVGLSYIPIRSNVSGQFYYGWLEIFASDYTDNDNDDFVLMSRVGLSDTPGLRVRMGQE